MSSLLDIQIKLQDTNAAIARLEQDLATFPDMPSLLLNIKSLQNRKQKLESEFLAASAQTGVDVCSYRFLTGHAFPKLVNIASALIDYQSVLSLVYAAIKSGPKQNAKLSAQVVSETALDFAYTFAGSVGFILTIPNEKLLLTETDLDEAIRVIFELSKAQKPEDILAHAKRLGPAPIRVLYKWAEDHVKSSFSADIEWRRGQELRAKLVVQEPEFERLQRAIAETSEETSLEMVVTGELVGVDVSGQTFHLKPDSGGSDVRGALSAEVSPSHTVELPKRYKATIRKSTKVFYSTEQEDVSYDLIRLEPI